MNGAQLRSDPPCPPLQRGGEFARAALWVRLAAPAALAWAVAGCLAPADGGGGGGAPVVVPDDVSQDELAASLGEALGRALEGGAFASTDAVWKVAGRAAERLKLPAEVLAPLGEAPENGPITAELQADLAARARRIGGGQRGELARPPLPPLAKGGRD